MKEEEERKKVRLYGPHTRHKNASQENKTPFQYLLKSFVYLFCCEQKKKKRLALFVFF
jgi:hypothetical protein